MTTLRNAIVVLLALSTLCWIAIECACGFGQLASTGVHFDVRSGVADGIEARSPAASAGIRRGDVIDFAQRDWLYHLAVGRQRLRPGQTLEIPLRRGNARFTAIVRAPLTVSQPADAWQYFVAAGVMLLWLCFGITLYLLRPGTPALVFLCIAIGQAMNYDNIAWLYPASPVTMPYAMLLASLTPMLINFSWIYFGGAFGGNRNMGMRTALLVGAIPTAVYYLHFYTATVWPEPFPVYQAVGVLTMMSFVAAAVLITMRLNRDASSVSRLRWVAAGVWLQAIFYGAFFVDESLNPIGAKGTAIIGELTWWLGLGTLCLAYALLRTRVIDLRIVGTRSLVYALLTAVPIGLFSVADWFFSRKLADARLATFVEFGVAVLFGIWLNTLHKRIDRFVERIVFASRHNAFERVRRALHALEAVERSETATALMCEEPMSALRLGSAAVFMESGGGFERVAHQGWIESADWLDADDPLPLFARSEHRTVRLTEVAPSRAQLPRGDARPEIAVPIMQHHRTIGIALYGRHVSGEHLDADEEALLSELAQAAAAALERLKTAERVQELEAALKMHGVAATDRI